MSRKMTYERMRDAAAYEASRIESSQAALVAAGCRVQVAKEEIERKEAFDALVRLLDLIMISSDIMAALKTRLRR